MHDPVTIGALLFAVVMVVVVVLVSREASRQRTADKKLLQAELDNAKTRTELSHGGETLSWMAYGGIQQFYLIVNGIVYPVESRNNYSFLTIPQQPIVVVKKNF